MRGRQQQGKNMASKIQYLHKGTEKGQYRKQGQKMSFAWRQEGGSSRRGGGGVEGGSWARGRWV